MENASKALLIAGAILVVIIIIGLGMMLLNGSRGALDEAVSQTATQEMEMFNSQFQQYEGQTVNGSSVKALINKITTNNVGKSSGEAKYVTIAGNTTTTASVVSAQQYTVTVHVNESTGLVDTVTINKK